jgi:hypothetical protein
VSKNIKKSKDHSFSLIIASWAGCLCSAVLLVLLGRVVVADFGGLRSCNTNSGGLTMTTCGKQGLNTGDILILLLFCLAACMVISLFTYARRVSHRSKK